MKGYVWWLELLMSETLVVRIDMGLNGPIINHVIICFLKQSSVRVLCVCVFDVSQADL